MQRKMEIRFAQYRRLCADLCIYRLVHKVYAYGMLAGIVISTTKVGDFLSAMAQLHIPKKLTIPIAVMLRYFTDYP